MAFDQIRRSGTLIAYEALTRTSRTSPSFSASEILSRGWKYAGYDRVRLNEEIPWALESEDLRSWNFHIHCWEMLEDLLRVHSDRHDDKYILPALRIADDWTSKHAPSSEGISPFAWQDMVVGIRAYRLAYILDVAIRRRLIDASLGQRLWLSLLDHIHYLANDANIAFHSNHGYYQVAAQLAVGRRFARNSPYMSEARSQARLRLRRMLKRHFSSEGIHREHSPDYHRMVYLTLRAMITSGLISDKATLALATRAENALSWFVLPSGHIANFGDSDYRYLRQSPKAAEQTWTTNDMRYLVTSGQIGTRPEEELKAFPEGGYCVFRRLRERLRDSTYLAQTCAFHSRTHKHADDMSFIWSDCGNDILVDAGRYGYIGKTAKGSDLWLDGHWYSDSNRIYCESTRAHNALEFNSKNYPRRGARPYGSALRRWAQHDSGIVAIESESRHFRTVRHARVLLLLPETWLIVFDWFFDNAGDRHDVRQWFHLSPHIKLEIAEHGYSAMLPASPLPLQITTLLEGSSSSRLYLAEEHPMLQGWWSPSERTMVPAYAFCYEQSGVSGGTFSTLFTFSRHVEPDLHRSRSNTSGRSARMSWSDDNGKHLVELERKKEGALGIRYIR